MITLTEKAGNNPFWQGALIFGLALVIAVVIYLLELLKVLERDPLNPWIIFTSFSLFYTIVTCVLSLRIENAGKYWSRSIIAFVAMLILSALTAQLLSGKTIDEASSFRWLFIVVSIGYLVFMAIVRLMKRIVDIAIKQDEKLRGED